MTKQTLLLEAQTALNLLTQGNMNKVAEHMRKFKQRDSETIANYVWHKTFPLVRNSQFPHELHNEFTERYTNLNF